MSEADLVTKNTPQSSDYTLERTEVINPQPTEKGVSLKSSVSKNARTFPTMSEAYLLTKDALQTSDSTLERTKTADPHPTMEHGTICSFYLEGMCRFGDACYNLHPKNISVPDRAATKSQGNKKSGKNGAKQEPEDDVDEKKPPMKTAGDVRKRIQWDPDLPKEYFTVGYLDRFSGVVEKPFTAFTWEHISTVDLDQLAVPQHRIQFFKYKDVKVWDKSERLDHVFGSAGNTTTIHEVIDKVEAEIASKIVTFDPDEESDDDEFVLMQGMAGPGGGGGLMAAAACQKAREEHLRATHFFCVKVNNEEMKRKIATVQERVVQEEPVLRSCAMPLELLHVTLAMVNFSTPEALLEAGNMLQRVLDTLKTQLGSEDIERETTAQGWSDNQEKKILTEKWNEEAENRVVTEEGRKIFDKGENEGPGRKTVTHKGSDDPERKILAQGLSTFGARVLYSRLTVPESFNTAVCLLQEGIRNIPGAVITNNFDFVPHLTLLKVNRPTARERRSKYINSCLYSDFIDSDFGVIEFNNLHLCPINDMRGPDGFYVTFKRIDF